MEQLERQLDSFDADQRRRALEQLWADVKAGRVALAEPSCHVNLHCHTFFSYNTYGYSPSKFAWLARKKGLVVAGIVDFDVLDGLEEFAGAGDLLNLRTCVGLETRAYVPEFSGKEITSPGEPGITYHMGVGFPSGTLAADTQPFLSGLRQMAQKRNLELMQRVNLHLDPVQLDYDRDVLGLTPAGNATERHLCVAYARKAKLIFPSDKELASFWSEKLAAEIDRGQLPESPALLNLMRGRTMKRGGVGYVQPDAGAFPKMAETNRFVAAAGGIPTMTWLDGTSDAEQELERLVELAMSSGVAAINTIPDRNFTPGVKDQKLKNLYEMVDLAERLHLPVIVGTEMNSSGQKFVDNFGSEELAPLLPVFLKGGYIAYAHSVLQRTCGLGYMSRWARTKFDSATRNDFFESVGKAVQPTERVCLKRFDESSRPDEILREIGA